MLDDIQKCCGTTDKLAIKLMAGSVRRYHTKGRQYDQNVAEHTWRGLIIMLHLWPDVDRTLITAFLYHDVSEVMYGDIPAPAKRFFSVIQREQEADEEAAFLMKLDIFPFVAIPLDYARCKCVDYLELAITSSGQVRTNGLGYVREWAAKLGPADYNAVVTLAERIEEGDYDNV